MLVNLRLPSSCLPYPCFYFVYLFNLLFISVSSSSSFCLFPPLFSASRAFSSSFLFVVSFAISLFVFLCLLRVFLVLSCLVLSCLVLSCLFFSFLFFLFLFFSFLFFSFYFYFFSFFFFFFLFLSFFSFFFVGAPNTGSWLLLSSSKFSNNKKRTKKHPKSYD